MIEIDKTLISSEVLEKKFVCDLAACKGACCVEGDAGAPLNEDELTILDDIFEDVKPYLREKGIKAIEEQGKYIIDTDGDYVTPLVDGAECAYTLFDDDGTAKCGIEKAYLNGDISFKKPISCHLFPIRISSYARFDAVNYSELDICEDAVDCGMKLEVKVYRFLKEPLIRKYGAAWYDKLCEADAEHVEGL